MPVILIPKQKVDLLPVSGSLFWTDKETGVSIILYRTLSCELRAWRADCRHQCLPMNSHNQLSGRYITCVHHGWSFDAETGAYTYPASSNIFQDSLNIRDNIDFIEVLIPSNYFDSSRKKNLELSYQLFQHNSVAPSCPDFSILHVSHACAIFSLGDITILSDPWFLGDAFSGWWPITDPAIHESNSYLNLLGQVNYIYISHSHADHFSLATLEFIINIKISLSDSDSSCALADKITILVSEDVFSSIEASSLLAKNCFIQFLESSIPYYFVDNGLSKTPSSSSDSYLLFVPDLLKPNLDSGLYLSTPNIKLLNTVDCCSPDFSSLPDRVDILMTDFASGASGYPCLRSDYSNSKILSIAASKQRSYLKRTKYWIDKLNPLLFIPFAGYFVETPSFFFDVEPRNPKNNPFNFARQLLDSNINASVWVPVPGNGIALHHGNNQASVSHPSLSNTSLLNPAQDINLFTSFYQSAKMKATNAISSQFEASATTYHRLLAFSQADLNNLLSELSLKHHKFYFLPKSFQ